MNKKSVRKTIATMCAFLIITLSISGTAFAVNGENVNPASQTTQKTSTEFGSFDLGVNPMSLEPPTSGTDLPYNGSFTRVNSEIFSSYYFFTNGATQFYVDWNVTADYPIKTLWHINVYQAGTDEFVVSSRQFNTSDNTGNWTSRFYNLDPAYNYYISFVNDGPPDHSTSISGDFEVRLD